MLKILFRYFYIVVFLIFFFCFLFFVITVRVMCCVPTRPNKLIFFLSSFFLSDIREMFSKICKATSGDYLRYKFCHQVILPTTLGRNLKVISTYKSSSGRVRKAGHTVHDMQWSIYTRDQQSRVARRPSHDTYGRGQRHVSRTVATTGQFCRTIFGIHLES